MANCCLNISGNKTNKDQNDNFLLYSVFPVAVRSVHVLTKDSVEIKATRRAVTDTYWSDTFEREKEGDYSSLIIPFHNSWKDPPPSTHTHTHAHTHLILPLNKWKKQGKRGGGGRQKEEENQMNNNNYKQTIKQKKQSKTPQDTTNKTTT